MPPVLALGRQSAYGTIDSPASNGLGSLAPPQAEVDFHAGRLHFLLGERITGVRQVVTGLGAFSRQTQHDRAVPLPAKIQDGFGPLEAAGDGLPVQGDRIDFPLRSAFHCSASKGPGPAAGADFPKRATGTQIPAAFAHA